MGYFVVPSFYYSPPVSDNYHDVGVVPHHEIALSEEAKGYYISVIPEELDNQLSAALAFVQSDAALTPPPTAGSGDSEGTPQTPTPPASTEKDGFFSSNAVLLILFGVLLVAAVTVTVYLIVDLRRNAKRQRDPFSSDTNRRTDN